MLYCSFKNNALINTMSLNSIIKTLKPPKLVTSSTPSQSLPNPDEPYLDETEDELTFPPFSSVSRFGAPQWLWLDLEASGRSAAHSPAAQWSMNTHRCLVLKWLKLPQEDRGKVKETEKPGEKLCSSYLACFGKSFPNLAVASTVAGRDEVSNAATLQEGGWGDRAVCAEDLGKGNHLHQAETNDSCFGVVAKAQAITETCSHCYNVLQ